jgi:hypothetical protein
MMKVVKTLYIINWHSLQELDRRFCVIPVQWSFVTHMNQEKFSIGSVHLSNYSTQVLYLQFISAQNLSHTSPSPCVFASSILNIMGYEILSKTLSIFLSEFKFFRISTHKFSERFWRSTAELLCLYFVSWTMVIYYHYMFL